MHECKFINLLTQRSIYKPRFHIGMGGSDFADFLCCIALAYNNNWNIFIEARLSGTGER